ncbi:MAG: hypothetical protein A2068_09420 [Ignavibacteria bacterium GWB2_35_6b]|nr:MAG: hypothetical protein A2068_09420 [Ignavibacteria bacterium GWB2_35_6b]
MDNLLEIIIILFFVLSGIKSLFGDKKKRRQNMEEKIPGNTHVKKEKKFPKDENELFETIFGIPKPTAKTPDPFDEPDLEQRTYSQNENRDYENTWNPEDEFEKNNNYKPSQAEKKQKIFEEISRIDYDKQVPVKSAAKEIVPFERTLKVSSNNRAIEIRRIFKNKKSVKDAIIIAEILNKPKALRR